MDRDRVGEFSAGYHHGALSYLFAFLLSICSSRIESVKGQGRSSRSPYPGLLAVPIRPVAFNHQHKLAPTELRKCATDWK